MLVTSAGIYEICSTFHLMPSRIVKGQVVSETKVNVQDAVEIGQDTRTSFKSFVSSLPGGFNHPIKKTVETMHVLKRGVKYKGKTVYDLETVFVPPSLIDQYG